MSLKSIKLLDDNIANRIAAGEVIERPASVVKELLENAIDAGSKRIQLDIRQAGFAYIGISDDGWGIFPEELPLAFLRHATSKIDTDEDLLTISTLGFRGEALASIAAVSRVEAFSRRQDAQRGAYVRIEGGQILKQEPIGSPKGTRIIVQDLFYNTPARKKFLKSEATEKRYLVDWVQRLALANPHVNIRLLVDEQELLSTPGTGQLKDALTATLGSRISKDMLPIQGQTPPGTITGFIGKPELAKGQRSGQFFILNNRYIQSPMLASALEKGYGSLLMTKRFPMAVVHLNFDPGFVDVNVHPTKIEVRFRDDQLVYKGIMQCVRSGLGTQDLTQSWTPKPVYSPVPVRQQQWTFSSQVKQPSPQIVTKQDVIRETKQITDSPAPDHLKILGQVFSSFIIIQKDDDLLLIDQHAAHERILYEQLCKTVKNTASQTLLFPITIELSPEHNKLWQKTKQLFLDHGFHMEEFGSNTYLLRAVPTLLGKHNRGSDWQNTIINILDNGETDKDFLVSLACHGAIKAGQELSMMQMNSLIQELFALDSSTCPHGRPTILRYSKHDMEKHFGRKG